MESNLQNDDQTILLGVPKVQYSPEGLTPFPSCLNACANYMGIEVSYDYTMAASGAAFRLAWDETAWNLGNVDTIFTYEDPERIFKQGVSSIGCRYRCMGRKEDTQKIAFINFIKEQIDKGNPVIGLGIIGPPEACIITGYRNGGETLLGWNFFQDNPEFNLGIQFDESGYFMTDCWWENKNTIALISLEPEKDRNIDIKVILNNAIDAMTGRRVGNYAKGILAYDAWIKAVEDEREFPPGAILPILAERLFTHGDAIDCISDGRYNASIFIKKAAKQYPEHKLLFEEAANYFVEVFKIHEKMFEVIGGWERGEPQMRRFANTDVRKKTVALIRQAKTYDEKAFAILKQIVTKL